jgi:hypothetical protein
MRTKKYLEIVSSISRVLLDLHQAACEFRDVLEKDVECDPRKVECFDELHQDLGRALKTATKAIQAGGVPELVEIVQ